jgi:hypothetical protein
LKYFCAAYHQHTLSKALYIWTPLLREGTRKYHSVVSFEFVYKVYYARGELPGGDVDATGDVPPNVVIITDINDLKGFRDRWS